MRKVFARSWWQSRMDERGLMKVFDEMDLSDDVEVAILSLADVEKIKAALYFLPDDSRIRNEALALLTASRAQAGAGTEKT